MLDRKTAMILGIVLICTILLGLIIYQNANKIEEIRALITSEIVISTTGQLIAIGVNVYWDAELTNETTEVNWGIVAQGSSTSVTFYIKSISNVPIELRQTTSNWNPPEASSYIYLNWNYTEGTILQPTEVICVTETLVVDATIHNITSFSFDITIESGY